MCIFIEKYNINILVIINVIFFNRNFYISSKFQLKSHFSPCEVSITWCHLISNICKI